jgi:hypothetical protein
VKLGNLCGDDQRERPNPAQLITRGLSTPGGVRGSKNTPAPDCSGAGVT